MSNDVHFVLQGKGGVGKSLCAAILAQYLGQNTEVTCIDTDPVNKTLSNYHALNVQHIQLLDGARIDERQFDALMERLLSEDGTFVVDNGASSFVPLSSYILENDVFNMLAEAGRRVYVHTIITGNQALLDTLHGFAALASQTNDKNIVVWLNEYFGAIESEKDGKMVSFSEMISFKENRDKVHGIIKIAKRNHDTFGKDIEQLVSGKLTFQEGLNDPAFSIMARQRLKTVRDDVFSQLKAIGL